jgi:uncharacterized YigZ family protein
MNATEFILNFRRKKAQDRYMKIFSYKTIKNPSEGNYKEKGSKFLGFAYPVESEEEVKQRLSELRKKYFDARHHCYAFMLGVDKARFRVVDDGEPNHSAGDPILGQIRSKEITNVLIVVVRYFGGTKLGVGGLISAYRIAADNALRNSIIIECEVMQSIKLQYDFSASAEAMRLIKEFDVKIFSQDFNENASLAGQLSLRNFEAFTQKIQLLKVLGTPIKLTE